MALPLQFVGAPLAWFLKTTGLCKFSHSPWMSAFLTLPVSVEDVGFVAALCALDPSAHGGNNVLSGHDIEAIRAKYAGGTAASQ